MPALSVHAYTPYMAMKKPHPMSALYLFIHRRHKWSWKSAFLCQYCCSYLHTIYGHKEAPPMQALSVHVWRRSPPPPLCQHCVCSYTYTPYMVMKNPPPMPALCLFITPIHTRAAMAASTSDPPRRPIISLQQRMGGLHQYEIQHNCW